MKTISNNTISEYEVKKSKFITLLFPIQKEEEVAFYYQQAKQNYPDATHYCYAYKLQQIQKFSDDKEPSGTAGLPMMEVINQKNLTNLLCIVVRYFGGIKLGSGGLIRAYRKAVVDAIAKSTLIEIEKGYLIQIKLPYESQKQFDYTYQEKIFKKEFHEKVIYQLEIAEEELKTFPKSSYQILEERMIEKRSK